MNIRIIQRQSDPDVYQAARAAGCSQLQAKIISQRNIQSVDSISSVLQPGLKYIFPPSLLEDIEKASSRIGQAVMEDSHIGIVTDYDVDGITSHAIIHNALSKYFKVPQENIQSFIGHRLKDGYGLSHNLVEQILAQGKLPGVIITADCGSSDEERIARLKKAGIDVIVTDHHLLPVEGPPKSAFACINPGRDDCKYPDSTIAGCMTAWLLMSQVRNELVSRGHLENESPKLSAELDFVALGTVADCVSLASPVNRAVVTAGLNLINSASRPCWSIALRSLYPEGGMMRFDDLGFQLGPRINARSRMADPFAALRFLLANDAAEAQQFYNVLNEDNNSRKVVEKEMLQSAINEAEKLDRHGKKILCIHLEDGHAGVQGIIASRIVERFGKPTIIFCPHMNDQIITGSGRSIDGIDMRALLQSVDNELDNTIVKFGGHKAAAGITIILEQFDEFYESLHENLVQHYPEIVTGPVIYIDDEIEHGNISLESAYELEGLAPYGRGFEAPVYANTFIVRSCMQIGDERQHIKLELEYGDKIVPAIWFYGAEKLDTGKITGMMLYAVFHLSVNRYRGRESLQLRIEHAELALQDKQSETNQPELLQVN